MSIPIKQEMSPFVARFVLAGTKAATLIANNQTLYRRGIGIFMGIVACDQLFENVDVVHAAPRVNLQDGPPVVEPVDFPTGLVCGGGAIIVAIAWWFNRDPTGGDNRYKVSDKNTNSWGSGRIRNAESAHGNQESDPPSPFSTVPILDDASVMLEGGGRGIKIVERRKKAILDIAQLESRYKNAEKEANNLVPILSNRLPFPMRRTKGQIEADCMTNINRREDVIKMCNEMIKVLSGQYHSKLFDPQPEKRVSKEAVQQLKNIEKQLDSGKLSAVQWDELEAQRRTLSSALNIYLNQLKY